MLLHKEMQRAPAPCAGAGGSGTGGTGTGGSGGTGGSLPAPECVQASDCVLHSDCCSCVALAAGEAPPPCNFNTCLITTCVSMGVSAQATAQCNAGRCSVGFSCDASDVQCMVPTPNCDPGLVNAVTGICWGPCVPAQDCAYVPSCASCDPNFYTCVSYDDLNEVAHCVGVPNACKNDVSCSCMSNNVCIGPYDDCSEENGTPEVLHCRCPSC